MANPQKENGFIGIANELYEQLMIRDFTRRQKSVLELVLRLSYGCNKKIAYIPQYTAAFECVGVLKGHIKKEIEKLIEAKVISINDNFSEFQINKNYEEWSISFYQLRNNSYLNDLVSLNLNSYQKSNFSQEESYQNSNPELLKKELEVTKKVTESYQNSNSDRAKNIENTESEPCLNTIKDSKYNKTTINNVVVSDKEFFVKKLISSGYKSIHFFTGKKLEEELRTLYSDLRESYSKEDIKRAALIFKNKDLAAIRHHANLLEGICNKIKFDNEQQVKKNNPPLPSYYKRFKEGSN